jgi:hypothetical protein
MADKNTPYSDIWSQWSEMTLYQRKSIGAQMLSFLKGASLSGVVEILENAPLPFKKAAWEAWTQEADLSGYLLGDVLALTDTETPTIAYSVVKSWLKQADLGRANDAQVLKMSAMLTTLEDRVALWSRWIQDTDLRVYGINELVNLMGKMHNSLHVKMLGAWLAQMGKDAPREMHRAQSKTFDALQRMGEDVIRLWNQWYN